MKREPFYSSWFLFFSRPIATVGGAALILAVFGMLSRILGLIRDRLLASTFGAGDILDVYYASFRIPDFLYGILVLGGLSAAFIPIFSKIYTKGNLDEAWKLTSDFLVFLVGSIAFLACILFLGMPVFIYAVAPGFEGLKLSLTIELTRIMLLSPIILGASAVFGGVLILDDRFFLMLPLQLFTMSVLFLASSYFPKNWDHQVLLGVLFWDHSSISWFSRSVFFAMDIIFNFRLLLHGEIPKYKEFLFL